MKDIKDLEQCYAMAVGRQLGLLFLEVSQSVRHSSMMDKSLGLEPDGPAFVRSLAPGSDLW